MPTTVIDGLATRYEVRGEGFPLLLFSPGGFDATLDNWATHGVYRRTGLVDRLAERYRCIVFDRREAGESGGRVERVTWADYAAQGHRLLDHLGVERAALLGGCVGCSVATAFAVAHPERTAGMVLYSPAGGAVYRMTQHRRFAEHAAFVAAQGLAAVVDRAKNTVSGFNGDPAVGPWAPVLRTDPAFAQAYAALDPEHYRTVLDGLVRTMFDRDSVPGPEPEDLLTLGVPALVVPGQDRSHARSAAWFLHECLPGSELWDAPVAEQTAETAPARVLAFLDGLRY
ncbi:Pimeloyl-ACP methyl ester carboxylesterase [Pseudonocardia ammonioxydans]|uniref:Pimeloyl-ACP methyl ester carboxylesterase n=1 Tax=Pseudonocardia ammonioxydans TaxID=260086 RepID=A0A1I5FWF8_PSUAM|nr:alpha/beta hydrolase [Pseudonocardia ammonioxydans]SFO28097.1 Pimeloyl-ACP methyl ester carboxylesterase [Pseudonocardia ammonioxydans]